MTWKLEEPAPESESDDDDDKEKGVVETPHDAPDHSPGRLSDAADDRQPTL